MEIDALKMTLTAKGKKQLENGHPNQKLESNKNVEIKFSNSESREYPVCWDFWRADDRNWHADQG